MVDFGSALYFAAVVAGTLILGVTIAYAFLRFRKRTNAERRASDRAAHRLYKEEDKSRATEEETPRA